MKRLSLALIAIGVSSALGGDMATPAGADPCAISVQNVGLYKNRTAGGTCIEKQAAYAEKYVIVKDRGNWHSTGIACAQVTENMTGNYTTPNCADGTQVVPGNGQFIKIQVGEGWFGRWWVASLGASALPAGIQVTKLTTATATLKAKVAGATVEITTSTAPELTGLKLEGEGKIAAGTVKFKGLTTKINGSVSAPCTPSGTVTSNKLKGGFVSHEGSLYVQLTPESGSTLVTIPLGEECSIGEEIPVITKKEGKGLVLSDPLGIANELKEHEATALAALTELWMLSETAEHKATVEGKAAVGLTGEDSGLTWKGAFSEFEIS